MRWVRDHIRHGSWLALVAIAINFALAFGHVHASDGTGSERAGSLVLVIAAVHGDQTKHHPADNQADYLCPICMAAAAMGAALAPMPPASLVEFATATIDHAIEQGCAAREPQCAAFQPRGPPIS
jgi:hypothetical protein